MEDTKKNLFAEDRETLHKQFELLAERSKDCEPAELAAISEQMIAIHRVLHL